MEKTGSHYPNGPCELPLECSRCGTVITKENVRREECGGYCEICQYCGPSKCPNCDEHVHCGGCI